ncbi:MAG: 2-keto-4-pentenoate hydratase [Rhodospirillales bacterium]|nr:2-keto-4-pentenoate hydratase [Rhodospirillales bacterium]MDE2200264.1 2-keto-4-pentenoate hydratase [Rhodospirillales bacterium]MDE2574603.1 2-keto-4-pentenoate hydratase [Rhodospirillales bacterium]
MTDLAARAADLLLEARRDPAHKLAALPEALRPADRAGAYAIQQHVMAALGGIGGWKVSPFAPDAPPMCGPLPVSGITPSPARIAPGPHALRGIEAEISVHLGADLPPRATPYSRAEVIAAIATMHPAIEVIDSRFVEPAAIDMPSNIADIQSHGGFVHGPGIADWQGIDLARESVEQFVDGALNAGRTGHPGGDLIGQVVWLANEGSVWAGGLRAGQFVTCGSWTGANRVGPAARVRVKFASFAEVLLDFAG